MAALLKDLIKGDELHCTASRQPIVFRQPIERLHAMHAAHESVLLPNSRGQLPCVESSTLMKNVLFRPQLHELYVLPYIWLCQSITV